MFHTKFKFDCAYCVAFPIQPEHTDRQFIFMECLLSICLFLLE